jgi:hypothetical protein
MIGIAFPGHNPVKRMMEDSRKKNSDNQRVKLKKLELRIKHLSSNTDMDIIMTGSRLPTDKPDPEDYFIYFRRWNRDHIFVDDDTVYSVSVSVPRSEDSEDLKPLHEMPQDRWEHLRNSLCTYCAGIGNRRDILPDAAAESASFSYPQCGEEPMKLLSYSGTGFAKHENGEGHEFKIEIFEQWRRGDDIEDTD